MKTLFAVLTLVLSLSAMADQKKVSFSYHGYEGSNRSFYSCSYAEAQTEKFLELFGATQVYVSCFGGIQYGNVGPVHLTATFETPVLVGTEMTKVSKVKGDMSNPACGLNTTIVSTLLPYFSNVKVLNKDDSCAFARTNYSYTFQITK
jgi:hypothetical protein